jgi:peptidoglycan/xylan/chitin deacetylase (PgdA/CDA1 family)
MLDSLRNAVAISRGFLGGVLRGSRRHHGIRVFRYHGVIERQIDPLLERNQHLVETFRSQMAYLRRFRVLSLDELLDSLQRPVRSSLPTAVVTFDDGFANNLRVAEVMHRYRLPWCLFVPVGEVGERHAMWLDELSLLLLAGEAPNVEVFGSSWALTSREDRERAFRELRPRLKRLSAAASRRALAEIRAQYPAEESLRLIERFPGLRMLNWRELSELAASGVEIGSHGVNHDLHHSEQPCAERLRELSESRSTLESRLGRPCRAFAFPNGDYVSESPDEVARTGYTAAFTTDARAACPEDSRYLLPRLAGPRTLRRFVRIHWFKDPPTTTPRVVVAPAGARL